MKLLSRTTGTGQAATESSVSIDNWAVAKGTIILALIQAFSTFSGNYLANIPKSKADEATQALKEKYFQVQLLQRAFESDNEKDRASTLRILLDVGLLNDPGGKLSARIKDSVSIPKWYKHPLESSAGTWETGATLSRTGATDASQQQQNSGDSTPPKPKPKQKN